MMKSLSKLPQEIEDYIKSLPPSSQNNSRQIVRGTCERVLEKCSPYMAAKILNAKYGFGLDPDYDPHVDEDRGNWKSKE